jgi:hypothetical protein
MPTTIYKKRKCLNADCPNEDFRPRRSDQLYCDGICRSKHHFTRRKEELKTKYAMTENLKSTDKTLGRLYANAKNKNIQLIPKEVMDIENIPINSAIQILTDQLSGAKIHWFYEYGFTVTSDGKFKILKRSQYGKA